MVPIVIPIGIWFNHLTRKGDPMDWEKIVKEIWIYIEGERTIGYVPWVIDPKSEKYDSKKHGIDIGRAEILEGIESILKKYPLAVQALREDICPRCKNLGVIIDHVHDPIPCDCEYGQRAVT